MRLRRGSSVLVASVVLALTVAHPVAAEVSAARGPRTLVNSGPALALMSLDRQLTTVGFCTAPPDVAVAAGPTQVVEMVNCSVSIWDKASGSLIGTPIHADAFFPRSSSAFRVSDPRVLYDAIAGRWIASAMGSDSLDNGEVYLAMSATGDPAGTWNKYRVAENTARVLYDQPRLGVVDDKVIVAWDDYQNGASFIRSEVLVAEKADMIDNLPTVRTARPTLPVDVFAPVPAHALSGTTTGYLVYNDAAGGSPAVGVIRVTGTPAGVGPAAVGVARSFVTVRGDTYPPAADQSGAPGSIDTGDDRLLNAVWKNEKLWGGATVECRPAGDTTTRPCARLYQLSAPTTGFPAVLQDFDVGRPGAGLIYPVPTINGHDDMILSASLASSTTFVSAVAGGQLSNEARALEPLVTVKAGVASYDETQCYGPGPSRWGDYSSAAVDPVTPLVVWTAAEYAGVHTAATQQSCNWGTAAMPVTFAAPAVSSISPAETPNGTTPQITISGSGFAAGTRIFFGGVEVTPVTIVNATTAIVNAPAAADTTKAVTAQTVYGTSSAIGAPVLTYRPQPVVASLTPDRGTTDGGTAVVVRGSGFTGAGAVTFGGVPAAFTVDNASQITAISPARGAGAVDVIVSAGGLTSAAGQFTYVAPRLGYWLVGTDGGIFAFGDAGFFGSTGNLKLNKPIVGMAATRTANGYWFDASDGGIFAFGDAGFFGSTGNITLNKPIVGMAATPTGLGYWLVASDGGLFAFGDAGFFGSTGNIKLNKPIVGMAATPTGLGYWLVASDGGIFAFGDAGFFGSTGNLTLNKPIVAMTAGPSGNGYWFIASDGGLFAFGDAGFFGSAANANLRGAVTGMSTSATGGGYWIVSAAGEVLAFGDAPDRGSAAGLTLSAPVVGMAAFRVSP